MPPATRYTCTFSCGRQFVKDFMIENEQGNFTMCLFCNQNNGLHANIASLERENTALIEEVQILKRKDAKHQQYKIQMDRKHLKDRMTKTQSAKSGHQLNSLDGSHRSMFKN